jgi:hypothetical protein
MQLMLGSRFRYNAQSVIYSKQVLLAGGPPLPAFSLSPPAAYPGLVSLVDVLSPKVEKSGIRVSSLESVPSHLKSFFHLD